MNDNKTLYIEKEIFSGEDNFSLILKSLDKNYLEFINRFEVVEFYFFDSSIHKTFAMALFVNQKLVYKKFNIISSDPAGIRKTNKLIDLPENLYDSFLRKFNNYFSKGKVKGNQSHYKQELDFIFDIFVIGDGVKARNINKFHEVQLNVSDVDQPIPAHLIDRMKSSEEVPFHQLVITLEDIDMGLKKLESFYYHTLNVWFFPERLPICQKAYDSGMNLKCSKQEADRKVSQRRKDTALEKLADVIKDIQKKRDFKEVDTDIIN